MCTVLLSMPALQQLLLSVLDIPNETNSLQVKSHTSGCRAYALTLDRCLVLAEV